VKALLTEQALGRLGSDDYCFCPDETCDVVYFDADGQRFTTGDVRVPVWQKLPFGSRLICYCFGESEASIRSEFESTQASDVVARVRAHIAADRCACDVRNPRGACCLGDLIAAVQRVEDTVGDRETPDKSDGVACPREPRRSAAAPREPSPSRRSVGLNWGNR
jgi:hypothetical protein